MLFEKDHRSDTRSGKFYAVVELIYTFVDFAAAMCFMAGSILFLYKDQREVATWLFIAGSVLFALKPTIRTFRELKLVAMGKERQLAEKEEGGSR
jgi:hypothetical protein